MQSAEYMQRLIWTRGGNRASTLQKQPTSHQMGGESQDMSPGPFYEHECRAPSGTHIDEGRLLPQLADDV